MQETIAGLPIQKSEAPSETRRPSLIVMPKRGNASRKGDRSPITQSELTQYREMVRLVQVAEREVQTRRAEILAKLRAGAEVEEGFLVAEVTKVKRYGRTIKHLRVRC